MRAYLWFAIFLACASSSHGVLTAAAAVPGRDDEVRMSGGSSLQSRYRNQGGLTPAAPGLSEVVRALSELFHHAVWSAGLVDFAGPIGVLQRLR